MKKLLLILFLALPLFATPDNQDTVNCHALRVTRTKGTQPGIARFDVDGNIWSAAIDTADTVKSLLEWARIHGAPAIPAAYDSAGVSGKADTTLNVNNLYVQKTMSPLVAPSGLTQYYLPVVTHASAGTMPDTVGNSLIQQDASATYVTMTGTASSTSQTLKIDGSAANSPSNPMLLIGSKPYPAGGYNSSKMFISWNNLQTEAYCVGYLPAINAINMFTTYQGAGTEADFCFGTYYNQDKQLYLGKSGNIGIMCAASANWLLTMTSKASTTANTILQATTGTYACYHAFWNTSLYTYFGVENSAGGSVLPGSSAYAAIWYRTGNYPIQMGTNGNIRLTIGGDGTLTIPYYSTGILHSSSAGLISSSLIVAADIVNNTLTNTQLANLGTAGTLAKFGSTGLGNSLLAEDASGVITMNEGTSHYSTISLVHTTATGYVSFSAVNDDLSSSLVSTVYGHSSAGGAHCGLAEASLAHIYSYSPVGLLIDVGQSVPIVFGIAASEVARVSPGNAASPNSLRVTGLINCVDAYQNVIVSSPHGLLTTAQYNAVFGYEAMYMNQTSPQNTACGTQALYHINSGVGYNVGLGTGAGQHFTGGEGHDNSTGTYSVFLGANTLAHADGETNQIVIGYGATGNGSNTATYGNTAITSHKFPAGTVTISSLNAANGIVHSAITTGLLSSSLIVAADVTTNTLTYATMQQVSATSRVLGRITAGAGNIEELTAANLKTMCGYYTSGDAGFYLGTTSIAMGRASAAQALTGITGLDASGANFVLKNNNIAVMTSEDASAVVNTLYLKAGLTGFGTSAPVGIIDVGTDGIYVSSANHNCLNTSSGVNTADVLHINYVGYNAGTTQFRSTSIDDGKHNSILYCLAGTTNAVGIGNTAPGNTLTLGTAGNATASFGIADVQTITMTGDATTAPTCSRIKLGGAFTWTPAAGSLTDGSICAVYNVDGTTPSIVTYYQGAKAIHNGGFIIIRDGGHWYDLGNY